MLKSPKPKLGRLARLCKRCSDTPVKIEHHGFMLYAVGEALHWGHETIYYISCYLAVTGFMVLVYDMRKGAE